MQDRVTGDFPTELKYACTCVLYKRAYNLYFKVSQKKVVRAGFRANGKKDRPERPKRRDTFLTKGRLIMEIGDQKSEILLE